MLVAPAITGVDEMPDEELARWMCLVEGVNIIFDRFEDLNIPESEIESKKYSKRIDKALEKYIKERFNAMLADIRFEKAKAAIA